MKKQKRKKLKLHHKLHRKMKHIYVKYMKGFTIVELLVVIIVIGIIAALVFNAFGDAQKRARNAKTATAVTAYKKGLVSYSIDNFSYPVPGSNVCLGEGYPNFHTASPGGDCYNPSGIVHENPAFLQALKNYMGRGGQLPNTSNKIVDINGKQYVGAVFYGDAGFKLDGIPWYWWIMYVIEGKDAKCPVGPIVQWNPYPNAISTAPASGFTEGSPQGSLCYIPLPNPRSN